MTNKPYATDIGAGFTTDWMVPPPPVGTGFQVTRDEWREDSERGAVRQVWAWRPLHPIEGVSPIAYATMPRWRRALFRVLWWWQGGPG